MRIITWRALRLFAERWPASTAPLRDWYAITERAIWRSFADIKATFGQTDQARVKSGQTVCIFDIGGNRYRLIAFVSHRKGKVYVLRVMTHKEYDRGHQQWKNEL